MRVVMGAGNEDSVRHVPRSLAPSLSRSANRPWLATFTTRRVFARTTFASIFAFSILLTRYSLAEPAETPLPGKTNFFTRSKVELRWVQLFFYLCQRLNFWIIYTSLGFMYRKLFWYHDFSYCNLKQFLIIQGFSFLTNNRIIVNKDDQKII